MCVALCDCVCRVSCTSAAFSAFVTDTIMVVTFWPLLFIWFVILQSIHSSRNVIAFTMAIITGSAGLIINCVRYVAFCM